MVYVSNIPVNIKSKGKFNKADNRIAMVFLHVSVLYLFSYLSLAYGRMNMLSYVNDNHMKPIDSNYISQQLSHPATATDHTTLNDVRIAAESGGHIFCPLIEQSWACTGQNYTQLLVDISPFDALNYGMQMVKHGTFVYGEGGSHIAQLLLYWACSNGTTGGNEAKVYKLPSNLGTTTTESALGTDYFIHIPSRDATFLFLFDSTDNAAQHRHNNDPCGLMFRAKYLREKEPERVPSIIVLGDFDDGSCLATDMVDIPLGIIDTHQQQWKDRELAVRHGYYTARFPSAHIIQPRPKSDAGGGILSYFQQCIPGPLVREAELLAADIIEASHQPVFISPATTLDTSQYGNPLSRFSKEPLPSKANLSETLDKYYGENVAAVLRTFESTSSVSALVEHRRDPAHAWNTIRGRGTFVWAEVAASAKAGGHEYCTVSKDLWVCSGERYISVLLDTAPFDASRYSIDMVLPNNGVSSVKLIFKLSIKLRVMSCRDVKHAGDS